MDQGAVRKIELYDKLLNVERLRSTYNALTDRSNWQKDLYDSIIIDISYDSNKIEGLELNYNETLNFFRKGLLPQDKELKLSHINELSNHRAILREIFEEYGHTEISEDFIKSINKRLLETGQENHHTGLSFEPGEYKFNTNGTWVKGENGQAEFKEFLDPVSTPGAMRNLIARTNQELALPVGPDLEANPMTKAANFHYDFCAHIHPFPDGNGRVGRLISNIIQMKGGYLPVNIQDSSKQEYYQALSNSSLNDKSPLLAYWYDQSAQTYERTIKFVQEHTKA